MTATQLKQVKLNKFFVFTKVKDENQKVREEIDRINEVTDEIFQSNKQIELKKEPKTVKEIVFSLIEKHLVKDIDINYKVTVIDKIVEYKKIWQKWKDENSDCKHINKHSTKIYFKIFQFLNYTGNLNDTNKKVQDEFAKFSCDRFCNGIYTDMMKSNYTSNLIKNISNKKNKKEFITYIVNNYHNFIKLRTCTLDNNLFTFKYIKEIASDIVYSSNDLDSNRNIKEYF